MRVLGIDPGGTGALALYAPGIPERTVNAKSAFAVPEVPETLHVWDMPTNEVTVGSTKRKRLDMLGLLELFDNLCLAGAPDRILVEQVGGMPGQASGFAFGFGVGALHMALTCRGLRFDVVTPTMWKKAIKAPKDKAEAVVRAEELLPAFRDRWRVPHKTQRGKTVVRPDRAEAALLAYYGATVR